MTPYCSLIDVGLFLETNGEVRTCCPGSIALGNIRRETAANIFKHNPYIEIKQSLDQYKPHQYCSICASAEQVSSSNSLRLNYNIHFPSSGTRELKQIDLRWSNVCNLSCKTCTPDYSSEWAKLLNISLESSNRDYYETVFELIEQNKHTIQNADLLGGEPLLQKQNERLLEILDPGTAISIVTNLSVNLENNKIYNSLKKRKKVSWRLSIDHIGDKLEYIRTGASWSKILHNINLLKQDFPNSTITVLPVYSIWNAADVNEICSFINDNKFLSHWQLANQTENSSVYGTDTFIVFNHNTEIKSLAISAIDSLSTKDPFFNEVRNSLSTNTDFSSSRKFLSWTNKIEKLMPSRLKFADLWPELNTILKNTP